MASLWDRCYESSLAIGSKVGKAPMLGVESLPGTHAYYLYKTAKLTASVWTSIRAHPPHTFKLIQHAYKAF